jgi:predicted nucleic acid-binding protein
MAFGMNLTHRVMPGLGLPKIAGASWVFRHSIADNPLVVALRRDLDRGEAETIALAIELSADLVLLDERDGRKHAQRQGLGVVGVLGILIDAKKSGLIEAVLPQVDAMRRLAGFYVSASVYEAVRQLTHE